jgi:hypothetical protein
LLLLSGLAIGGCGDSPAEPDWSDLLLEVEANRATWEAARPANYTLWQRHECACQTQLLEPAIVTVEGDVVVSAAWEADGSAVAVGDLAIFQSVEELFTMIENAANSKVPELEVQFHPQLGYPTVVLVDYDRRITEDDHLVESSDLAALP